MSDRQDPGTREERGTEVGNRPSRKRAWRGPVLVALGVLAALAVVVGGLYVALMRVPAAPPRTQQIGAVRVTLSTDPRVPWTGPADLSVSIVDGRGTPVTDAAVTLTYDMETDSTGRRLGSMGESAPVTTRMDSPGRYRAGVNFTMAGQWLVRVSIARGGKQEGQGQFLVTVR